MLLQEFSCLQMWLKKGRSSSSRSALTKTLSSDLLFKFHKNTGWVGGTVTKRVPIIWTGSLLYVGTGSLQGPFLRFGSLFIFQGPYFQCFGFIHAKNVNSVCMYTTMSYLDLSVMSNDLHCYYMYIYVVN